MTSRLRNNHRYGLAEAYGRHSHADASTPVAVLLRRVAHGGGAVRSAWPVERSEQTAEPDDWPTAVLPRVR
jgi:hypothetical protein